jgi:hypothetical protein
LGDVGLSAIFHFRSQAATTRRGDFNNFNNKACKVKHKKALSGQHPPSLLFYKARNRAFIKERNPH